MPQTGPYLCADVLLRVEECASEPVDVFPPAEDATVDANYAPAGITPSLVTKAATIFMVGAVDVEAERQRLRRENEKLKEELDAARRAVYRQAAPFSRGTTVAQPRVPGRKSGDAYGRRGSYS